MIQEVVVPPDRRPRAAEPQARPDARSASGPSAAAVRADARNLHRGPLQSPSDRCTSYIGVTALLASWAGWSEFLRRTPCLSEGLRRPAPFLACDSNGSGITVPTTALLNSL
jgi:hypothetical protein